MPSPNTDDCPTEDQPDPFDADYTEEEIEIALQQLACSDDELEGMLA